MPFVSVKKLVLVVLVAGLPAWSWDTHRELTSAALAKESALDRVVTVTPMEQFLRHNFGEACTWDVAKDVVFDGVGRDFELHYQSRVHLTFTTEWESANNILAIDLSDKPADDPLQVGHQARARDVVSVYSDEPDWKLDDDVPRLASKGQVEAAKSGTATRALRHFWTPGEEFMGIDLGKGQETDRRMQLYYELALIAFEAGDDYWGYRFIGNASHYVQDVSQPMHTMLISNYDMLDLPVALHRAMCDADRSLTDRFDAGVPRCRANETANMAVVEGGWYAGTYHGLFEDFGLALLQKNAFGTRQFVLKDATDFEPITWQRPGSALLDVADALRQVQRQVVLRAEETSKEVLATFGTRYVRNRAACEKVLREVGLGKTREYRMGASFYLDDPTASSWTEYDHRKKLVELTAKLQRAGATWTRQLVRQATAPLSEAARAEVRALRAQLADRCGKRPVASSALPGGTAPGSR